jgi:hypothetical protein
MSGMPRHNRHNRSPRTRARHIRFAAVVTAIGAVGIVAFVATSGTTSQDKGNATAAAPTAKNVAYDQAAQMNVPIVATPGTAFGTASAGGVSVKGSEIAMGHVRLNVLVAPTWTIRNTTANTVTLGSPTAEVHKGCCPGALGYDNNATTLAPGASTTLRFGLTMHPGMDGPHDFTVHVPVGQAQLSLAVTGNFSA